MRAPCLLLPPCPLVSLRHRSSASVPPFSRSNRSRALQALSALGSLCLSGCTSIGDDVTLRTMPNLERLSIYDCANLTPVSWLAMVAACPRLWKDKARAAITVERCELLKPIQHMLPEVLRLRQREAGSPGAAMGGTGADPSAPLVASSARTEEHGQEADEMWDGLSPLSANSMSGSPGEEFTLDDDQKLLMPLLAQASVRVLCLEEEL